jgi:hypothetical protein
MPAVQAGKVPDPNTRTAASRPALLYFRAVSAVRSIRISLLTSGAKRARTADLLHAIWRQHVHPRLSVQATVLPRPRESARVRVSCCTSALYLLLLNLRSNPRICPARPRTRCCLVSLGRLQRRQPAGPLQDHLVIAAATGLMNPGHPRPPGVVALMPFRGARRSAMSAPVRPRGRPRRLVPRNDSTIRS